MAEEKAQADVSAVSQARKRKSGDDMETSERPEKTSRVTSHGEGIDVSDSESELSSLGSPVILPSLERPVTPMRDEAIAPPASSDSEDDGAIWPDIQALGRRRRRPSVTHEHLSDVSSPPSLTHSPNFQATKRGRAARRQRAQSPEITTAHLANLLPKRRVKKTQTHVHEEAVDTSGLAQDDDELQLDARASRRNAGTRASSRNIQTDNALQPRQTPAATTRAVTRSSSRAGKTYSRRASDKENEDQSDEDDDGDEPSAFVALPDDTFGEESDERQQFVETRELKAASEKFKEVDMWELSFEEVVEAEEVAPVDAR
jgi:ATP-dependent RNA helicase MRH4